MLRAAFHGSTTHCDAMWYVRTLPGVCGAFAAAYECTTEDIVAAYDRMSVNLPTSSGNEAALRVASRSFEHGKLNAQELHTHFNQDGYGDELICYGIMPLWDMNKAGGASASCCAVRLGLTLHMNNSRVGV